MKVWMVGQAISAGELREGERVRVAFTDDPRANKDAEAKAVEVGKKRSGGGNPESCRCPGDKANQQKQGK